MKCLRGMIRKTAFVILCFWGITFVFSGIGIAGSQELLLKILIRKGIITPQEALEIKQQVAKEKEERRKYIEEVKKIVKEDTRIDKDIQEGLVPEALRGLKFGMLSYVDYSVGKIPLNMSERSYNKFSLTRGYLTLKKEFLPWLHARVTYDIHREAGGDYKGRIKYLYAELRPGNLGLLTDIKMEIGQGHIPWLDFEEHVNPYRMQGTMAIERAGVFNSADLGVSIRGYFGGRLKDARKKTGSHHYIGRYGSWHIGIYNGSGYHRDEHNTDKVLEGRLTLRPLPDLVPGLQLSYFGIYGEGDTKAANGDYPEYKVNLFMLSYECPGLILTGQYFRTKGNSKGDWVDANGDPLRTEGFSFFSDFRLPVVLFSAKRLHIFGRFDYFDQDASGHIADDDTAYRMYMVGLAYEIYKENKFIMVFEKTDYDANAGAKGGIPVLGNNLGDEYRIQGVMQIKF